MMVDIWSIMFILFYLAYPNKNPTSGKISVFGDAFVWTSVLVRSINSVVLTVCVILLSVVFYFVLAGLVKL